MAVKTGKCAHACSVSQDSNLFFKLEGDCFTVFSLLYNMNSAISVYIYIYIPSLVSLPPTPPNKVIYLNLSFVGSFRMSFNFLKINGIALTDFIQVESRCGEKRRVFSK